MGIWIPAAALVLGALGAQEPRVDDPAPFVLGLCAREDEHAGEAELGFAQGARLAAGIRNRRGGIFGHPIELVLLGGASSQREARSALDHAGDVTLTGVIAPWSSECAGLVREACTRRGVPVAGPVLDRALEAQALVEGLVGSLRFARIGILADARPAAKRLREEIERRLKSPCALVLSARIDLPAKELARRLSESCPDVLVLDAPPEEAEAALSGSLAEVRTPLVLGARASGPPAGTARELLFVHGLSPATAPPAGGFLEEVRKAGGEPGPGAVEGYEIVELFAFAIERAGSGRPEALRDALATMRLDGPRGPVAGGATGEVPARPALWRLTDRARPLVPPALAESETISEEGSSRPDSHLGPPLGSLRTDLFGLDPDTRWVRVHFGEAKVASIDSDLARIGLSTGGASPFVDHLVREELLARTLSIVSQKYLRDARGHAVGGQSFRVSFAAHLPPGVEKSLAWDAQLAGADPKANGRAFPGSGHCEIFSTNWLATVAAYALTPPIGPEDLGFLDGTYVHGSDYEKDRRSELIRALVESYAGSLGLTCAHEVGHLFGLEHESGDPHSLMTTDEETGVAPENAHFSEEALERLRKTPGVVK